MYIESFSLSGMWSFGPEQKLLPDRSVTALIGRNNQGKSNLLRALGYVRSCGVNQFTGAFVPHNANEGHWNSTDAHAANASLDLHLRFEPEEVARDIFPIVDQDNPGPRQSLRTLMQRGIVLQVRRVPRDPARAVVCLLPYGHEGNFWNIYNASVKPNRQPPSVPNFSGDTSLWNTAADIVWEYVRNRVVLLEAWRAPRSMSSWGPTYTELIHDLHSPKDRLDEKHSQLVDIQNFFRELVEDPTAIIVGSQNAINISTGSARRKILPLTSYGDGIRQLLMMATEIATRSNSVFLIEEPEISLHPSIQRKFVEFVRMHGNNQYVFTTHSSVFLNSTSVDRVVHVSLAGGHTSVMPAITMKDKYAALDNLGVHASDVLQTDYVIWVEGPSDAVFLGRCIELAGQLDERWKGLTRGVHFDFVFYGGSNRAHIKFGDDEKQDLLNVLRLGRKAAYVWDSDMPTETSSVNQTKTRLEAEARQIGAFSWMTYGREIENYLTTNLLRRVYASEDMVPAIPLRGEFGRFDRLDSFLERSFGEIVPPVGWKARYKDYKVRIMEKIVRHMTVEDLQILDLRDQVLELCKRIREANPATRPL